MGYIRKHWVIFGVSAYPAEKPIKQFNEWLKGLPADKRRFIYTNFTKMNGYKTVFMDWDGSKEGWETSDQFDTLRDQLRTVLTDHFEHVQGYAVFDDEARDEPHLDRDLVHNEVLLTRRIGERTLHKTRKPVVDEASDLSLDRQHDAGSLAGGRFRGERRRPSGEAFEVINSTEKICSVSS